EHHRALAEMENGKREALGGLRSQLSQTFVDQRRLASHADEQELELNRLRAEHQAALMDTETRHRDALAELRRELAQTAERAEQHEHERERLAAEHRRTVADLQASKQEAVAECERVLTEVQQALLVRDTSRHLEIERRLVDGIDQGPQMKIDGQRLAAPQRGLTLGVSQMQAVFKDEPALKPPLEAEPERAEDADLLH